MQKGFRGRIAIIGGSEEYTGAPYFAGIGALRSGADYVSIFCTKDSAIPIKAYSPDIIVHPLLVPTSLSSGNKLESIVTQIISKIVGFDILIIGPGLGKNKSTHEIVKKVFLNVFENIGMFVFDAEGLDIFISTVKHLPSPERIKERVIITPNLRELKTISGREPKKTGEELIQLSKELSYVNIISKRQMDVILTSDGIDFVEEEGTIRRCAGQGDLLCGCLAACLMYNKEDSNRIHKSAKEACVLIRKAGKLAYEKYGRGTITSDFLEMLPIAISDLQSEDMNS